MELLIEILNKDYYEGYSYLMKAIISNRLDLFEKLLNSQVDIDYCVDDTTAASLAVLYRRVDMLDLLILHGADVNRETSGGDNLLTIAAWRGNLEIISILLKAGINVNHTDDNGATALMVVCGKRRNNAIPLLLDAGADVSIIDNENKTAIDYADRDGRKLFNRSYCIIV